MQWPGYKAIVCILKKYALQLQQIKSLPMGHGTVVTELDTYVPADMSDIVDTAIVYMITFVIEHQ